MAVDSILIICALLKAYQQKKVDRDSIQRMQVCVKMLTNPQSLKNLTAVQKILTEQGRSIFSKFLESHSKLLPSNLMQEKKRKEQEAMMVTQPDEMVVFRQLKGRQGVNDFDITDEISSETKQSDFLQNIKNDID